MRSAAALAALVAIIAAGLVSTAGAGSGQAVRYVVVYAAGADQGAARKAVADAGGTIVSENTDIGVATVTSAKADFRDRVAAQKSLEGAAVNQAIGVAPRDARKPQDLERVNRARSLRRGSHRPGRPVSADPLSPLQWDMQAIGATPKGSYRRQQGSRAVRVGIIDTGIDGSHPDIAPNFDSALSRNFTVDDPIIDGPCSEDPDGSCNDPNNVDEDGHGTHVAGTIGSPLNGQGIGGVAPRVDLVNLRAGQDSGYFFLGPTVDALTFAGDHGIDVVNMSFYVDPWLYNCAANPADSPAEQLEQRTIIRATQRALNYARARGVTLVSALGNESTDMGNPTFDDTSPDYPPDSAHARNINNSCIDVPAENDGVVSISATGPTGRKAYYSNYGTEQTDFAAPGGDYYDTPGGTGDVGDPANLVLAPEGLDAAHTWGDVDENGDPTSDFVLKDHGALYQYLQGTSMASPHAAGVAALIVAQYGQPDWFRGGLTLAPDRVEQIMRRTATKTACPVPATQHYFDDAPEYDATCVGTRAFNGFYGSGVVNAEAVAGG